MNRPRPSPFLLLTALLAMTAVMAGCTTAYHRKKADEEIYSLFDQAEREVFGEISEMSIDTRYSDRPPGEWDPNEILEERLETERLQISLEDALQMAILNSREYQTRKENLYLTALALSDERNAFRPRFFASSEVLYRRTEDGERFGEVESQVGVNQLLKNGAQIGVAVTNDLLQYFTGDPRRSATTGLSIDLVQPLLRGAGARIVAENLLQAERNLIYEIRDFAQYQQAFAVDVAASYYRILQRQDEVRNEYTSYQNLIMARDRAEALARDRLPEFQADQALQDELRARNRYVLAVEDYLNALDQFKIQLGIPVGFRLILNQEPLQDLLAAGLIPVRFEEEEALAIALESRLDLLNEIDRFEDAQRQIEILADLFKPDLNIFANTSLNSNGETDYAKFDLKDYDTVIGIRLDLPLDRLDERNQYRASIIQFERQLRTLGLTIDTLRNDIRESIRTTEQARQSYLIQQRAVELADRRVESATLLFEAGRAEIRDLLEAEADRVEARNALTQALIDYHLARYQLFQNLGILEVDEEGFWIRRMLEERAKTPDPAEVDDLAEPVITPDELFAPGAENNP